MLYPSNLEVKLGFDKIRELLNQACLGPIGQFYVEKMSFSTDYQAVSKWLAQTAEYKSLLENNPDFILTAYTDINAYIKKISLEGAFLDEKEIYAVRQVLQQCQRIIRFFEMIEGDSYPALKEMSSGLEIDRNMMKRIDQVIDQNGRIRDDASHELMDIRRNMVAELSRLRKTLNGILKIAISKGYIDEEANVTIRNGRLVIPILAEYKRKFKGFIHDESATGQTVYLEPEEVLEINNYVKELEYAERREIIRILTFITDHLRGFMPTLQRAVRLNGQLDFIQAKARFAGSIGAKAIRHTNTVQINLENAYHPLLYLFHKKQNKAIVPLTIQLEGTNKRLLVISGPNAGGKSVLLKTVGLLQYMHQCGLLVSADDASEMGFYTDIFIDIGDEQSLENDLSTYSSHLTNMRHFLAHSSKKSMILIDEFGTGTDPQYGGAIAEAILESLHTKQAMGIVNTHYTNLKNFAEHTPGMINGAMCFDPVHMEPLYKLEMGTPGSSFALEIAQKIGLPLHVIEKAKEKVGQKQIRLDQTLLEVQKEKELLRVKNLEMASQQKALKDAQQQYEELNDLLSNSKKKLLNEAKEAAAKVLKDANQVIEKTIREIKEGKADKDVTRIARDEVDAFRQKLKPEAIKEEKATITVVSGEIKVGDYVRVIDNGTIGEIAAIKGKEVEMLVGEMKLNMKLNRLEKISRKDFTSRAGKPDMVPKSGSGIDLIEKRSHFSYNVDFRGKRGEDTVAELIRLIDDALILGVHEFRIVHGKGDGILRQLVRAELKKYKQFSFTDEHADRGGDGVTIVTMK